MSIELLSEPIRRFIRDKRWEKLRPIQAAAIEKLLTTDSNYILASRTASGKTEAAFLPILSKVDFRESGVQVLYISPLIALINDQFYRVEDLCKYLDVAVTKWHGEANKSAKDKLIKNPIGIVLITPESIEAMFVNKPFNVKHLFSNLKYVVIDEIHSFIGSDRGIQLKSLLARLSRLCNKPFIIVGLSATIGDYNEAKKFTGNENNTKVLLDRTSKDIKVNFRYFEQEGQELSVELLQDLYLETKDNKVLIFPNSRGRAEEVSVKLKRIATKAKGHLNYFSHHSSIDKELREYVETFAKTQLRQNFCISCTSTLELGIDIGTVDEVVQIDATHSISSLIQRVGRSGRKDNESSNLFLYATNEWSLLQSLACWLLYQEKFVEPPTPISKAYDLMLHQLLSIVKSHSGIEISVLVNQMRINYAFSDIEVEEVNEIIDHLIRLDLLEKIRTEVVIGVEGEKIVNNRNFYTVFKTEENFKVIHRGHTIGEIPFSPQIVEDENILLAAKMWKITFIDDKAKKIEVIPATDGKKPQFFGSAGNIHPRVRVKMLEILMDSSEFDYLDVAGMEKIREMRILFSAFLMTNSEYDRPVKEEQSNIIVYTFSGSKINRTISFLLSISGLKNFPDERSSSIDVDGTYEDFIKAWQNFPTLIEGIDSRLCDLLESNPNLLEFSKWGAFLPDRFKLSLLKDKFFDFDFLMPGSDFHFVTNRT